MRENRWVLSSRWRRPVTVTDGQNQEDCSTCVGLLWRRHGHPLSNDAWLAQRGHLKRQSADDAGMPCPRQEWWSFEGNPVQTHVNNGIREYRAYTVSSVVSAANGDPPAAAWWDHIAALPLWVVRQHWWRTAISRGRTRSAADRRGWHDIAVVQFRHDETGHQDHQCRIRQWSATTAGCGSVKGCQSTCPQAACICAALVCAPVDLHWAAFCCISLRLFQHSNYILVPGTQPHRNDNDS